MCLAHCVCLKLDFMVSKGIFNKILKVFQMFSTSRKLRYRLLNVILY